jgi:hypothetical protein
VGIVNTSTGAVTSIAASRPTITTSLHANSSSIPGWTTNIAAGTWIEVSLYSVATFNDVTLALLLTRA